MEQQPSIGRIVHFTNPGGVTQAALIIEGDPAMPGIGVVLLRVFARNCQYDIEAPWSLEPKPGCWSWPPRV